MKPGKSSAVIVFLPRRSASVRVCSKVSCEVASPRMISTSFIAGTGFMKCIPMKRGARLVRAAIRVIEIDEVLEAKIDLGRADLVEFLEQRDLGVFVFDHRLDHEIGLAEVFEPRGGLDAAEHAVALFGLDPAALDHPIEVASDILHPAPAQVLADVVDQDLEARLPRHLGDSAAHLSRTHDAQSANRHQFLPVGARAASIRNFRATHPQSSSRSNFQSG